MVIKNINDIQQDSLKEIQASDIRDLFKEGLNEALTKANSEWETKLAAEKEAKDSLEAAKVTLEQSLSTQAAELVVLQEELKALKEAQAQAAQDLAFQSRMAIIDEEYKLEPDSRKIVAKAIKALDTDEDFQQWKASFDVVAGLRKQAEEKPEDDASESLASLSTDVKTVGVPNNGATPESSSEDLIKELKKSFSFDEGGVSFSKRLF
jgi:predicted nuclease with TOPRIM domain